MQVTRTLDCKGLSCPEPLLNLKMALNELNSGDIIEMYATDPGCLRDVPSWAMRTGNEVIDQKQEGDLFTYYVKKK